MQQGRLTLLDWHAPVSDAALTQAAAVLSPAGTVRENYRWAGSGNTTGMTWSPSATCHCSSDGIRWAVLPVMEPQPPTADPSAPEAPRPSSVASWRKIVWSVLALIVVVPLMSVGGLFVVFESVGVGPENTDSIGWLLTGVALLVGAWVVRTGLRREWPERNGLLAGWGIVAVVIVTTGSTGILGIHRTSQEKTVQSRLGGIRAAAHQYNLETGSFFVTYDELVGPTRYLRSLSPVAGEDYRTLFPLRQDQNDALRVTLRNGRVVTLNGPMSVPDGVRVDGLGRLRVETTYRDGWPEGPSRVLDEKGTVVSEANFVQGHIVGPCWFLYGGQKVDLNQPANRPSDGRGR